MTTRCNPAPSRRSDAGYRRRCGSTPGLTPMADLPALPARLRRSDHTSDRTSDGQYRNLVERFFSKLKQFRAVPPDTTSATTTSSPQSNSLPSAYGCDIMNRPPEAFSKQMASSSGSENAENKRQIEHEQSGQVSCCGAPAHIGATDRHPGRHSLPQPRR